MTHVETPFVARVAGVPAAALTALRSHELLAHVRELLATGQELRGEGGALADELYAVVSGLDDPRCRPGLLGLRRALFAARRPRDAEWSDRVREALDDDLRARIERWLRRLAGHEASLAALQRTVDREAARTLGPLLAASGEPALRHGIAQSSPVLATELAKITDGARLPRAVIHRLARYVSRAVAKTSPFSTLTTIGAGVWTSGPDAVELEACEPVGRLELQGPLFEQLTLALTARAAVRRRCSIRVNPSLTRIEGGRFMVIGPPPAEPIATVAAAPEVIECLRALGEGWRPLHELLGELSGDPARTAPFVDRLVEVGVLELRVPVDDQDPDRFATLAGWLRAGGDAQPPALADACERLSRVLLRPTDLGATAGHLAVLRSVDSAVGAIRSAAGLPTAEDRVHEHAVCTEPVVLAGAPAWRASLGDLDHVRRWLSLHDPGLPLRLALGAYVAHRFGVGGSVPFPGLYRVLLADLADRGHRTDAVADLRALLGPRAARDRREPRLAVLGELAALRHKSIDALLGTAPDIDGVVRVDARALGEHDARPDYVEGPYSVAWYVQPYGTGSTRLVLNTAISGYGRGRARWLWLMAEAGAAPPTAPPGVGPPGRRGGSAVAESPGRFGHVLNVREPLAELELAYPYVVTFDRRRPRVPLGELLVGHDPGTGLARLATGTGRPVTVVHNGMLAELLLPPAMQLLVRGLGATPTLFHPGVLLAPASPVGFAPRVEAGSVTLRRAAWTVPHEDVPRRGRGEADAGYLLRLHRWIDANGIPDRCFVRATAPPADGWFTSTFTKTRKPLYVDFASPWLLGGFERMIAEPTERVTFTEVLPPLPDGDGARVVELVIETSHP